MNATMLKIDEAILESNKIICRQISRLGTSTRGEVSQEVLESLRHFVEHIILKEYANGADIEDTHDNIKAAVIYLSRIHYIYSSYHLLFCNHVSLLIKSYKIPNAIFNNNFFFAFNKSNFYTR